MQYKILVVDNEGFARTAMKDLLERSGYSVEVAADGNESIEKIKSAPFQFGIVILDYRMPGKDGATTAKEILSITQDLYVLIHSADVSRSAMEASWNAGAMTFIDKEKGAEKFLETVRYWCKKYEENILRAGRGSPEGDKSAIQRVGFIGESKALLDVAILIEKLQNEKFGTVLITGESGTGKEAVALALHKNSPRKDGPFIPVNCSAIPETLIEGTLLVMRRALSPVPTDGRKGSSRRPRAEVSLWTKSETRCRRCK